jgi:hypothetical protein
MADTLASYFISASSVEGLINSSWPIRLADSIRKDPQAHIDALVEAGVLQHFPMPSTLKFLYYSVVEPKPPHVHDWAVSLITFAPGVQVLDLVCSGCPETRHVPNKLPIEVPE